MAKARWRGRALSVGILMVLLVAAGYFGAVIAGNEAPTERTRITVLWLACNACLFWAPVVVWTSTGRERDSGRLRTWVAGSRAPAEILAALILGSAWLEWVVAGGLSVALFDFVDGTDRGLVVSTWLMATGAAAVAACAQVQHRSDFVGLRVAQGLVAAALLVLFSAPSIAASAELQTFGRHLSLLAVGAGGVSLLRAHAHLGRRSPGLGARALLLLAPTATSAWLLVDLDEEVVDSAFSLPAVTVEPGVYECVIALGVASELAIFVAAVATWDRLAREPRAPPRPDWWTALVAIALPLGACFALSPPLRDLLREAPVTALLALASPVARVLLATAGLGLLLAWRPWLAFVGQAAAWLVALGAGVWLWLHSSESSHRLIQLLLPVAAAAQLDAHEQEQLLGQVGPPAVMLACVVALVVVARNLEVDAAGPATVARSLAPSTMQPSRRHTPLPLPLEVLAAVSRVTTRQASLATTGAWFLSGGLLLILLAALLQGVRLGALRDHSVARSGLDLFLDLEGFFIVAAAAAVYSTLGRERDTGRLELMARGGVSRLGLALAYLAGPALLPLAAMLAAVAAVALLGRAAGLGVLTLSHQVFLLIVAAATVGAAAIWQTRPARQSGRWTGLGVFCTASAGVVALAVILGALPGGVEAPAVEVALPGEVLSGTVQLIPIGEAQHRLERYETIGLPGSGPLAMVAVLAWAAALAALAWRLRWVRGRPASRWTALVLPAALGGVAWLVAGPPGLQRVAAVASAGMTGTAIALYLALGPRGLRCEPDAPARPARLALPVAGGVLATWGLALSASSPEALRGDAGGAVAALGLVLLVSRASLWWALLDAIARRAPDLRFALSALAWLTLEVAGPAFGSLQRSEGKGGHLANSEAFPIGLYDAGELVEQLWAGQLVHDAIWSGQSALGLWAAILEHGRHLPAADLGDVRLLLAGGALAAIATGAALTRGWGQAPGSRRSLALALPAGSLGALLLSAGHHAELRATDLALADLDTEPAAARATIEATFVEYPESAAGAYAACSARLKVDDAAGAAEACERAVGLVPTYTAAWDLLGDALDGADRHAEALDALDRALGLLPSRDRRRAETTHQRARQLYSLERYEEALDGFAAARRLDPDEEIYAGNYVLTLLELERYAEAHEACKEAIEIDEEYARAWRYCGQAARALGLSALARTYLEKAITHDPKDETAARLLSEVRAELRADAP